MIGFMCIRCKHYQWNLSCKAFTSPNYIPTEILTDEVDHDTVILGQEGDYVYTPKIEAEDEEQMEV